MLSLISSLVAATLVVWLGLADRARAQSEPAGGVSGNGAALVKPVTMRCARYFGCVPNGVPASFAALLPARRGRPVRSRREIVRAAVVYLLLVLAAAIGAVGLLVVFRGLVLAGHIGGA